MQKGSTGKTVALGIAIGLAVVMVAALAVGVYGAYGYEKVYPGVRVEGQSFAGLDRQGVEEKVTALLAGRSPAAGFKLAVGSNIFPVEITAEDMGYDTAATAEQVWNYGRQGGFGGRLGNILRALNGGVEVTPIFFIRQDGLALRAEEIARDTQQSIAQSSYTFDGKKLVLDRGQAGTTVSAEALTAFLMEKLKGGDFSDARFELAYEEPDGLDLLLIKSEVESDFQEARLDLESDPTGNTVIPAEAGVRLDLKAAQAALAASEERFVEIPVEVIAPPYTTAEYKAMLFRDVLASGTTEFNAALQGRTTNVLLANEACNGVILNPGDVFSYNDTVGPRTYERGFKDAIVYVGTSAEDGVGGGICQVSSTIYYACLRADLEIVERRSHSRMVTYVPLGEDATVAWGSTDYKFKNNTDFPIKIITSNTKNTITIELIGTQTVANKEVKLDTKRLSYTPFETLYVLDETLPVGTQKVDKTGYSGARTETERVVYVDGKEVSRTFENKSAYTKYDKVVLYNDGTGGTQTTIPVTDPTQPTEPSTPVEGTIPVTTDPPVNYEEDPHTTEPEVTEPEVTAPPEPIRTEPEVTEPEVTAPVED